MRFAPWLLLLIACGSAPPPPPPAPPPPPPVVEPPPPPPPPSPIIHAGPIVFDTAISRTAQLFYIVDQLARWQPTAHLQYARWAVSEKLLDDDDRIKLKEHGALRKVRGPWSGFDAAFLVKDDLDDAVDKASRDKLLTSVEAEAERWVLTALAPKLDPFIAKGTPALEAFVSTLRTEAPRIAELADKVTRFADVNEVLTLAIFPVVDPSGQGGVRYDDGRLVVEIADGVDPLPSFFHEVFRAILMKRRETIAVAAGKCKQAIDDETMMEGIVYALAPGMLHTDPQDGDPLAHAVLEGRSSKLTLRRPIARFQRLALALRPLLQSALDSGEPLADFLPEECDAWKAVVKTK